MRSPENIEKVLRAFGSAWPDDGSIVEKVMRGIEQAPPPVAAPKRRKILIKSLLAIAASLAACVTLWWAVDGNHNSLYAQVMDAARKARTIHFVIYGPMQREAEPIKTVEAWFKGGVGFRRDVWDGTHKSHGYTTCLANEDGTWTMDRGQKSTIIRSPNRSITKETEQIFTDIDRHARHLRDSGQRYPEGDRTFDGQPCKAYVLKESDRSELRPKSRKLRQLYYLDQQSRLVRVVTQEPDGDRWKTTWFSTIAYDEPLDAAFFQPNFGKDFKIVDANVAKRDGTARPTKPEGPVLTYEVTPTTQPADTTIDLDKVLRVVEGRLNAGSEKLAVVRKLDERRLEVTLLRRNDADRRRVERQLTRPGTLEFRVLANTHVDQALIDSALKNPSKAEAIDSSGKRSAWWVPVTTGHERSFIGDRDIVRRTGKQNHREGMEVLVVADPYNITGVYLTQARLQFNLRGEPCVSFTFSDAGGKLFTKLSGNHLPNKATDFVYKLGIILDGELFSAPSIQSTIGNKGQITGSFSEIDASDLVAVLNAGNLPVRLQLVDEHPQR